MKGNVIAILFALALILFLTVPVFAAADLSHTVEYIFNGTIDLEKSAGHFCNTGAEMKQEIYGSGSMTKTSDIYMKEGFLVVDDTNDFIASAKSSLTVTTAIKLCSPAKHVVDGNHTDVLLGYNGVLPQELSDLEQFMLDLMNFSIGLEYPELDPELLSLSDGDVISPYDPLVLANLVAAKPLTKQIWAASVTADPGYSGQLDTAFTAAYGPYEDHFIWSEIDAEAWANYMPGYNPPAYSPPAGPPLAVLFYNNITYPALVAAYNAMYSAAPILMDAMVPLSAEDLILAYNGLDGADNSWWYDEDGKIVSGPDYVGNYFMIDQFARTSMGTTKRYIDISSPFSHAFLHEDMTVVGRTEVRESFEMMNIPEGAEATTDWWDLF